MIPRRPSARRAVVDRWIVTLQPMFVVIAAKAKNLKLGDPALEVGPTYIAKESLSEPARVRRGAVWFVAGKHVGFHVDFKPGGVDIYAWQGKERTVSVFIAGKVSEATLKNDLKVCLTAAGLTDLAKTDQVRTQLFPN